MSLTSPATDSPSSAAKTRSKAKQRRRLRRRRLSHPGWRIWSAARGAAASVRRLGRGAQSSIGGDDSRGGVRRLVVNGGSTRRWRLDQRWCTARDGQSGVDRSVREDEMVARSSRRYGDAWLWPSEVTGLRSRLERRRFLMAARRGGNRRRTPAIGGGSARGNGGMSLGCVSVVMGLVSELGKSVLY
ncbi:hypothetical protein M6B38_309150 [Iris pallida]|uniref:Uncharacterized protein n=1 Tax=Iris pallida TaxID=29817 RepID=A0AAX6HJR2_IRIPA|nr:hypothetical protein M6B38_309150 [Iris pallida]